jgi:multidrug transporter EmrE-like cation transporter
MIYRIASWAGIAGCAAAVAAAFYGQWIGALGFAVLALICAGIVIWKPPE